MWIPYIINQQNGKSILYISAVVSDYQKSHDMGPDGKITAKMDIMKLAMGIMDQ